MGEGPVVVAAGFVFVLIGMRLDMLNRAGSELP